jgi:predicted patatin/cPLA2 family phospholipase
MLQIGGTFRRGGARNICVELPSPVFGFEKRESNAILVIPGGGMRNAFSSGVIVALGLKTDDFDYIVTNSSAAPTAALILSGQQVEARDVWVNRLTTKQIISGRNILWGFTETSPFTNPDRPWRERYRYPLNIDYLVDHGCADLDWNLVAQTRKLIVSVFDPKSGQTHYEVADNPISMPDLFKASMAVPGFARPVWWRDRWVFDGGTHVSMPVLAVRQQLNPKKILVIANRPMHEDRTPPPEALLSVIQRFYPNVVAAARDLKEQWSLARECVESGQKDGSIFCVAPEKTLPADRSCIDPKLVLTNYYMGLDAGTRARDAWLAFSFTKHR